MHEVHNRILLGSKNEWTADTQNNVHKSQKRQVERKDPNTKEGPRVGPAACSSDPGRASLCRWPGREPCPSASELNGQRGSEARSGDGSKAFYISTEI